MKKLACILLALTLFLGVCPVFAEQEFPIILDYHDYTQWPVVPEGETVKVTVAMPRDDARGIDADDMWFWAFMEQATGIDFEVEQILASALLERKNLMLGSGQLPDILWKLELTTADLVMYGEGEQMLLDLTPYINEDVMPNLCRMLEEFPDLRGNITQANGAIYTLPEIRPIKPGDSANVFANLDLMAAAGDYTEVPDTLDGLTEMLYAMKAANPDCIPLGGGQNTFNPMGYIMNGFGYLTMGGNNGAASTSVDGTAIAVRNGEAVIPAADPTFKEVLKLMNQYYVDGIIDRDFFTIDETTLKTQVNAKKVGIVASKLQFAMVNYEDYSRWISVQPLTSEWNDTKQWMAAPRYEIGGVALSAKTENPETILRMLDGFFMHEIYLYGTWGPQWGSTDGMGMVGGWTVGDNWNVRYLDANGVDWPDVTDYNYQVGSNYGIGFGMAAYSLDFPNATPKQYKFYLTGMDITHPQYNEGDINGYIRLSMEKYISPYEKAGFPSIVYMTEDDAFELNELESVLIPYMQTETAKFITGQRSLDEFDAYLAELEGMGMEDCLKYYQDIWANFK